MIAFPLTRWLQNTWPWMTLNGHFALNSVLRRYVWSSEVWLSKLGYSLTWSECCRRRILNRKEQLRQRAVSLWQHGFLVKFTQKSLVVLIPYLHTYSQQYFVTTLLRHIVFMRNVFCFNGFNQTAIVLRYSAHIKTRKTIKTIKTENTTLFLRSFPAAKWPPQMAVSSPSGIWGGVPATNAAQKTRLVAANGVHFWLNNMSKLKYMFMFWVCTVYLMTSIHTLLPSPIFGTASLHISPQHRRSRFSGSVVRLSFSGAPTLT